jgi:hypothetical protein
VALTCAADRRCFHFDLASLGRDPCALSLKGRQRAGFPLPFFRER